MHVDSRRVVVQKAGHRFVQMDHIRKNRNGEEPADVIHTQMVKTQWPTLVLDRLINKKRSARRDMNRAAQMKFFVRSVQFRKFFRVRTERCPTPAHKHDLVCGLELERSQHFVTPLSGVKLVDQKNGLLAQIISVQGDSLKIQWFRRTLGQFFKRERLCGKTSFDYLLILPFLLGSIELPESERQQ